MGKKTRREREKPGKAAPTEKAFIANSLAGVESADGERVAATKSTLPTWTTEEECLRGLRNAGFSLANFAVDFDSSLFCSEVQAILGRSRPVVDCTHLLPTGPGGDHHVLAVETNRLLAESQKNDSYFLLVRTRANTAAFLAGVRVYLHAAMLTAVAVDDYLKRLDSPTPSALVIQRGHVHLIPTQAITSVSTAGKMCAALIKKRPDMATCAICEKSFFRVAADGEVEAIATAIAGTCSHLLHPDCLRLNLSLKGDVAKNCPTCALPLPLHLVPRIYRENLTLTLGGGKKKFAVEGGGGGSAAAREDSDA
tara:strand:+ start:656 stop:1585 length:930 start_codon:yes stop_codon:yes gene_type:complete